MFPFPPFTLTCEETTTCAMLLNKAFLKLSDNAVCVLSKTSSLEDEQGGSSGTNSALVHVAVIIVAAAVLAFATKWLAQWYGFDQRSHNNVATKLIVRMESSTSTTTSKQHHQEESTGEPQPLQPETQQEVSIPDKIKDKTAPISLASSSVPNAIAMEKETKYKDDASFQQEDDFIVPPETWGFAIDDSKIQRKMLVRILQEAGVPTSRIVVMGKTAADVDTFSTRLLSQIQQKQQHDTNTKFLVLVDEFLDYSGADTDADATQSTSSSSRIYSGSLTVQNILSQLTPQQQGRVVALVRSANDTQHDIERCMQRGMHGFISKCHHGHDQVRKIVTQLWRDRFLLNQHEKQHQEMKSSSDHDDDNDDDDYLLVSREDLLDSLSLVEQVAQDCCCYNSSSSINVNDINWSRFWSALHTLKGDVSMVQGVHDLDVAVQLIHGLRGRQPPADLSSKWSEIQRRVHSGAQCLKMQ